MNAITFVTGNKNKVLEMERILGRELKNQNIDIPEIQSLDVVEVATVKANAAYDAIGTPVLVEDTSLVFHAFGKLPGTFVKWFMEEIGNGGLVALLDGKNDRSATATAVIAYHDGNKVHTFEGSCDGDIALSPEEGVGFGFDSIFIPEGYKSTWSKLPTDRKDEISHRAIAARKFATYLASNT